MASRHAIGPLRALALVGTTCALLASPAARVEPQISFSLHTDAEEGASSEPRWRELARHAAALEQLECSEDLVGATSKMIDAAEGGDSLAMAALGTMYLLGQQCAPKRNLTWGLHWLSRAESLGQPDAQAMMGFLHASDALKDIYNYTALDANRTHARVLYERAAQGGSAFGSMAVAFRHAHGIGLRESCAESAAWYEAVRTGRCLEPPCPWPSPTLPRSTFLPLDGRSPFPSLPVDRRHRWPSPASMQSGSTLSSSLTQWRTTTWRCYRTRCL